MNGIIDLDPGRLIAAYLFVVVLIGIVRAKRIPREREITVATLRMTVQLILMGYVLAVVFEQRSLWLTLVILVLMQSFAILNIYGRVKERLSGALRRIIALAMVVGSTVTLLFFIFVVINVTPWYEPRYLIPIAGMIVGNSMTGVSLGVTRLVDGMRSRRDRVEAALMLGATPRRASKEIIDNAFDSAILPTINSMVGMGIVFLPGMMTGQILSGVTPTTAIQYQIAIMLGITGAVSLTVITFVQFGFRTFFTNRAQLRTYHLHVGNAQPRA